MPKHKITYVGILQCTPEPVFLVQCFNLSDLPYFSRSHAKNLSTFTARELSKRVDLGFTGTKIDDFFVYSNKWSSGICILSICDKDYPSRTAFSFVQHVYFLFNEKYVHEELEFSKDQNLSLPEVKELMLKYKNPQEVDALENVYGKVTTTIDTVYKTVKEVLGNEESLEALVNQSKDLTTRTKDVFAKSRRLKRKSCCSLM